MQAGEHTFLFYWPNAARVDLSADFLARPVSMTTSGDGWWRVAVPIPDRGCQYCFLIDGCYRAPDYSAGEPQYDTSGNLVSVLSGATTPKRPGRAPTGQGAPRRLPPVITATETRAGHHPRAG